MPELWNLNSIIIGHIDIATIQDCRLIRLFREIHYSFLIFENSPKLPNYIMEENIVHKNEY